MVCSLRRGIRSSVDRRSESEIDGDDDDTDGVQPDSPPSFLAWSDSCLRIAVQAGKGRNSSGNKKALRARVELERASVRRDWLRTGCCSAITGHGQPSCSGEGALKAALEAWRRPAAAHQVRHKCETGGTTGPLFNCRRKWSEMAAEKGVLALVETEWREN